MKNCKLPQGNVYGTCFSSKLASGVKPAFEDTYITWTIWLVCKNSLITTEAEYQGKQFVDLVERKSTHKGEDQKDNGTFDAVFGNVLQLGIR